MMQARLAGRTLAQKPKTGHIGMTVVMIQPWKLSMYLLCLPAPATACCTGKKLLGLRCYLEGATKGSVTLKDRQSACPSCLRPSRRSWPVPSGTSPHCDSGLPQWMPRCPSGPQWPNSSGAGAPRAPLLGSKDRRFHASCASNHDNTCHILALHPIYHSQHQTTGRKLVIDHSDGGACPEFRPGDPFTDDLALGTVQRCRCEPTG